MIWCVKCCTITVWIAEFGLKMSLLVDFDLWDYVWKLIKKIPTYFPLRPPVVLDIKQTRNLIWTKLGSKTATDVKLKLWRTSEDAKVCLLTCCWPIHDLSPVMLQDLRKICWAMQVGVAADRSFTSPRLPRRTEKVKNRTGVFSRSAPNLTPSLQTADNGSILQHKNKAITRHIRLWLHWGVMFMNITWGFSPK